MFSQAIWPGSERSWLANDVRPSARTAYQLEIRNSVEPKTSGRHTCWFSSWVEE